MTTITKSSTGTEVLGHLFSVVFCLTAVTCLKGWAMSVVWGWFIVPTFGLPALSIPQAIGISIFAGLIRIAKMDGESKDGIWVTSAKVSAFIVLAVLIAWIVTKFI